MEDNILDGPLATHDRKDSVKLLIPLLILWAGMIWSYAIQESIFLIASTLTLVATALFLIKKSASLFLILIILVLGLIKVIYIFPVQILFGISTLKIDIICLICLIIALIINREILHSYSNLLSKTKRDNYASRVSRVNTFKRRFAEKNDEELKSIVSNTSLVEEAKIAAQELLSGRN